MKKREIGNLFLHITVGAALAGLVCWNYWFVILATFIYAWLREQAQHRYILTYTGEQTFEGRMFFVEKSTFFGWMTWHRIWEVFQWVLGAALALGGYEIWLRLG